MNMTIVETWTKRLIDADVSGHWKWGFRLTDLYSFWSSYSRMPPPRPNAFAKKLVHHLRLRIMVTGRHLQMPGGPTCWQSRSPHCLKSWVMRTPWMQESLSPMMVHTCLEIG
jgi:hypothetical protein